MTRWSSRMAALAIPLFLASAASVIAAEIKVLSSNGARGVVGQLAAKFEASTGHKIVSDFEVTNLLLKRIDAGEEFSVVILNSPTAIEQLSKAKKAMTDTVATIGRTGLGVGVPKGARKPDVGTVEGFKRALLDAKSIGYRKEGASGIYLLELLDRLGLGAEIKPRLKPYEGVGPSVEGLAAGDPDLVISVTPAFFPGLPGADYVGPLPSELQSYIVFTGAVGTGAKDPEAANAFVRFLTSPEAAPVFEVNGMERG